MFGEVLARASGMEADLRMGALTPARNNNIIVLGLGTEILYIAVLVSVYLSLLRRNHAPNHPSVNHSLPSALTGLGCISAGP